MPVIFSSEVKLAEAIQKYIDKHYNESTTFHMISPLCIGGNFDAVPSFDFIFNLTAETFSEKLMKYIERKGLKTYDVYKAADMTRQHFYKIKNESKPAKETALALAIALHLTLDETNELLNCAGYTLSHSLKSDLIVEYFIKNKIYDIDEINAQLTKYNCATLTNRYKSN